MLLRLPEIFKKKSLLIYLSVQEKVIERVHRGQMGLNILGKPKARSFSDPILRALSNHVLVNLKNIVCIIQARIHFRIFCYTVITLSICIEAYCGKMKLLVFSRYEKILQYILIFLSRYNSILTKTIQTPPNTFQCLNLSSFKLGIV